MTKYNSSTEYSSYIQYINYEGWKEFGEHISNTDYLESNYYGFSNINNGNIYITGIDYTSWDALNWIESISNLNFIYIDTNSITPNFSEPLIRYQYKPFSPNGFSGIQWADDGNGWTSGTVTLNSSLPNEENNQSLLHETLHALGLFHPAGKNGKEVYSETKFEIDASHMTAMGYYYGPNLSGFGPSDLETLWNKQNITASNSINPNDTLYNMENPERHKTFTDTGGFDTLITEDNTWG